jgi:hypothetical protein
LFTFLAMGVTQDGPWHHFRTVVESFWWCRAAGHNALPLALDGDLVVGRI